MRGMKVHVEKDRESSLCVAVVPCQLKKVDARLQGVHVLPIDSY